jgi:hypothetical protein
MSAMRCLPSRRHFLRHSGLGAAGLLLGELLQAQTAPAQPSGRGRARSVILIFNCGAPSHLDLWDPKPEAPDSVRGPLQPIATSVPGIRVSELLPNLARRADKYAIVRTVHHSHGGHNSGMYWSIVGRPYRVDSTLINPSRADQPSFGTLVGWLAQRDGHRGPMPPYVITPAPHCDSTAYITPGQFGACLGTRYDPFVLTADPNAANFRVSLLTPADDLPLQRLQQRHSLVHQIDAQQRIDSAAARDLDVNQGVALDMLRSPELQRAFDLSREPSRLRDRYGRHTWGQSHLLARRLVEAGVRFVTTVNGPSIIWDTHQDNFTKLRTRLVPPMEQAFAALLDDLSDRGLLDSTLVIWMGDFGRTPLINPDAGRDHWPQCYSMVLAGGGLRGGQVLGESDATGSHPRSLPVTPADIHATVFTALGYDPHAITYQSAEGRPLPLSDGEPLRQLL